MAACAIPSICIGLWLFFFPESPKFLLECGEADEALDVLRDMYASNTGDDGANYPVSTSSSSAENTTRRGDSSTIACRFYLHYLQLT